jgi:hypothetical protein
VKTKWLFIFELLNSTEDDVNDEVIKSGAVLGLKYRGYEFRIDVTRFPTASNWSDLIKRDTELGWACNLIADSTKKETDIGVYIVAHGSSARVAGLTSDQLAELLLTFGFENIRKLSIVACRAGVGAEISGDSYLRQFCKNLAERGKLTPKIAAYTSFVTVSYPGMTSSSSQLKTVLQDTARLGKGKKIIQPKSGGFRFASDAVSKPKVIIQYQSGNIVQLGEYQWTDR